MKKEFIQYMCLAVMLTSGVFLAHASEEKKYVYRSYNSETGKTLKTYRKAVLIEPEGVLNVKIAVEGKTAVQYEEYVIASDYSTESWSIKSEKEKTDITGKKEGSVIIVKGMMDGTPVNEKIEIDERPFYNHPKVNLTGFVLSERKTVEFWGLRKSTSQKYLLKAEKKGEEVITINNQPVEVVVVYFSPADSMLKKFYQRTYYFRKSDGLFLKKKPFKGEGIELFSEE